MWISHCSLTWSPLFSQVVWCSQGNDFHREGMSKTQEGRMKGQVEIKYACIPWLGGSVSWSIIPRTRRLQVQFLVRAHNLGWGFYPKSGGNQSMFLCLCLCLSLPPLSVLFKINKHILGWGLKQYMHTCTHTQLEEPVTVLEHLRNGLFSLDKLSYEDPGCPQDDPSQPEKPQFTISPEKTLPRKERRAQALEVWEGALKEGPARSLPYTPLSLAGETCGWKSWREETCFWKPVGGIPYVDHFKSFWPHTLLQPLLKRPFSQEQPGSVLPCAICSLLCGFPDTKAWDNSESCSVLTHQQQRTGRVNHLYSNP